MNNNITLRLIYSRCILCVCNWLLTVTHCNTKSHLDVFSTTSSCVSTRDSATGTAVIYSSRKNNSCFVLASRNCYNVSFTPRKGKLPIKELFTFDAKILFHASMFKSIRCKLQFLFAEYLIDKNSQMTFISFYYYI